MMSVPTASSVAMYSGLEQKLKLSGSILVTQPGTKGTSLLTWVMSALASSGPTTAAGQAGPQPIHLFGSLPAHGCDAGHRHDGQQLGSRLPGGERIQQALCLGNLAWLAGHNVGVDRCHQWVVGGIKVIGILDGVLAIDGQHRQPWLQQFKGHDRQRRAILPGGVHHFVHSGVAHDVGAGLAQNLLQRRQACRIEQRLQCRWLFGWPSFGADRPR